MAKVPKRVHIEPAHCFKGDQDWSLREVYTQGKFKVRIRIRRNAYDFQSYAVAEVWSESELKWNQVHTIPYSQMKTLAEVTYVDRATSIARFWADREVLVAAVDKILF